MLQVMFVIAAIMLIIEFFRDLCEHDITPALIGLVLAFLCGYSSVALGTFAFVMGIIMAVFYGLATLAALVGGHGLGFLINCAMLVLFIVGTVNL